MAITQQLLDRSALKFNQITVILLVLVGFILDNPVFPAFVAIVLIAGSIHPGLAGFKLLYRHVISPLKLLKPELVGADAAPHQFAQLLGGIFLSVSVVFLLSGEPVIGWAVSWLVVLLAATNLVFGLCVGCFVYYQMAKVGMPGFRPEEGTGA